MKSTAVLLIIASSALVSCECPIISCCGDVDTHMAMWIHDGEGRSLLDPGTPGGFIRDSVKQFSLRDGKLTLLKSSDRYTPYKIDTFRTGGKLYCVVNPALDNSGKFPQMATTVIKWTADDSDTIDFKVVDKCGSTILLDAAWYNGELTQLTNYRQIDVAK